MACDVCKRVRLTNDNCFGSLKALTSQVFPRLVRLLLVSAGQVAVGGSQVLAAGTASASVYDLLAKVAFIAHPDSMQSPLQRSLARGILAGWVSNDRAELRFKHNCYGLLFAVRYTVPGNQWVGLLGGLLSHVLGAVGGVWPAVDAGLPPGQRFG